MNNIWKEKPIKEFEYIAQGKNAYKQHSKKVLKKVFGKGD